MKDGLIMISACGRVALFASLIGVSTPGATAEIISPDGAMYTYNLEESDDAKLCEIILDLESPVPPELVEFTAFAGYGKSDASIAVGFIAMAAKRVQSDELALVPISDATFTSKTFRSREDMDYEVHKDGAVMAATLDKTTATHFLRAFASGNFELTLTRSAPESTALTYAIPMRPSGEVQDSFAECLHKLVPHSVSRGDTGAEHLLRRIDLR